MGVKLILVWGSYRSLALLPFYLIMKFYTSYFYKIRFFKPNMIPVSTAMFDPKWYRNNGNLYLDNNGVLNGLNCSYFHPQLPADGVCNGRIRCNFNPYNCKFLELYRNKINNLDFNKVLLWFNKLADYVKQYMRVEDPLFILIVYETPDNLCSERKTLQDYFTYHGYECNELEL